MEELENQIIALLNRSQLTLDRKAYVLKHVYMLTSHSIEILALQKEKEAADGDNVQQVPHAD